MSISGDYSQPVQVNGFTCKNCTDVDYAMKHIDPAHPKSGPYGVNTKSDPTNIAAANLKPAKDNFITFGGQLAQTGVTKTGAATPSAAQISTIQATAPGQTLNIVA